MCKVPVLKKKKKKTFFVCLTRAGARVARRKVRQSRVGFPHKIKKEEAIQWFQDKFEGVVLSKAL